MSDICMCGHTADEHEDDGVGLCSVVGCLCAGFEADVLGEDALDAA